MAGDPEIPSERYPGEIPSLVRDTFPREFQRYPLCFPRENPYRFPYARFASLFSSCTLMSGPRDFSAPFLSWEFGAVAEKAMDGLMTREVLKVDKAVASKINSLRDCCGGEFCILELYGGSELPGYMGADVISAGGVVACC